jgi:glucan biosynthesis protein C
MQPQRQFFLDWLRIGAFALLVLYHVGMYYVSWDWHVKSPHASALIEPLMRLSNPWRMSLLFLLSGAATAWMLASRQGPQGLLRERASRLLLPLITGMVLIVPPQPYVEVVQKAGYGGSYFDFLRLYFSAYGGFCRGSDCLVLPTWNHLWFLPYLFFYTALLLLLHRVLPARWRVAAAERFVALPAWQLWLLPVLLLALLRLALLSRFGSTHALVDDWFNHATYFSLFLLGAGFAARPQLFRSIEPLRWAALAVALLAWAGITLYFAAMQGVPAVPEGLRALQRVAHAALQWSAIVAILGFAHRHLNRDHRWRAPLTEAVFPVYLVHQTLIILLAMAFVPLALPAGIEAALLVGLTFALSLAFWRLARGTGPLRVWLGLPRGAARRTQAVAAVSA